MHELRVSGSWLLYLLKTINVFCVDQVEGKDLDYLRVGHADAKLAPDEVEERYNRAEAAIEATGADIRHGGNKAYYHSEGDYIVLPHRHQFSVAEYYETAFHELAHWTEHASRLNWDRSKPENSYGLGELIAELGGCFIAAALGVPTAEQRKWCMAQFRSISVATHGTWARKR